MLGAFVQANRPRLRLFCNYSGNLCRALQRRQQQNRRPVGQGLTQVGRCM